MADVANDQPRRDSSTEEKAVASTPSTGSVEVEKAADTAPPQQSEFPDGGLQAWATVLGFACLSYVTWGVVTSFGTYQRYISNTLLPDVPQSSIAWIGGINLFGLFAGGVVVGKLFDRGYCRTLLLSGTILYVVCNFLNSLCTELYQLILCQGIGIGAAMGLLFIPGVSAVSHWFKRKRAFALGIGAVGSSVGAIIIPIQLFQMFDRYGWAKTVQTNAGMNTALLIVANICVRPRLPPKMGGPLLDLRCFRDVTYAIYALGVALISLGLYIPMAFGPNYASSKGVSESLSFYVIAFLGAGSIFGRLIPNYIADKVGVLNVLFISCTVSGLLAFIWLACDTTASIIVFNVLYGFFSGAYVSATPGGVASLTPDPRDLGTRNGALFIGTAFTGLAGVPIGGSLVSISYTAAACFGGAAVLAGSACIGITWWRQRRKTGQWRV